MATPISVQITSRGLLIPRKAIRKWLDQGVDVIVEKERIIIRPKIAPPSERDRVLKILGAGGLLSPRESLLPSQSLSSEERTELDRKFSIGHPLSEVVIEERQDRV